MNSSIIIFNDGVLVMNNNQDENNELNEFEQQLKDINEWQENCNNPGHYIGSAKVPTPMKNLFKSPIVILILGVIIAIPTLYSIINDLSFQNILNNILYIIISVSFIVGGIIRMFNKM